MEYVIDAKGKTAGRIATGVARILCGKHRASYDPSRDGSDGVLVRNVKDLVFKGSKLDVKTFYRHTGYMGHLKERTARQVFEKDPARLLRHAVSGMLPKNSLRAKRLRRLRIE